MGSPPVENKRKEFCRKCGKENLVNGQKVMVLNGLHSELLLNVKASMTSGKN